MLDKLTWIIHEGGKRRATESLAGAIEAVSRRFYAPSRGGSMATDCIAQVTFKFDPKRKPIVAVFDQPHASSDGGAILLKGIDTQWGLTRRLAACLADDRQPGKVRHQTLELVRQRLFGLACGYADCNDAARLADDEAKEPLPDQYERRSEEHTSELQSRSDLVCRLLLEKKKNIDQLPH